MVPCLLPGGGGENGGDLLDFGVNRKEKEGGGRGRRKRRREEQEEEVGKEEGEG